MGILDSPPAFITQGDVRFRGEDLLAMPEERAAQDPRSPDRHDLPGRAVRR